LDEHLRYVRQFEEAIEQSQDSHDEAETARNYFDGKQWSDEEKAALTKRKQPIVWENLVKPKIEALCGLERQGRVDPKAYPRVPSKENDADAVTDALRYVEQDQDFDLKKSKVFEDMLIEGEGAVEVTVRRGRGGVVDPYIVRIAYGRLYGDPHSSEPDRSDASYVGYITWMDIERAKRKWPDKVDVLEATQERGVSSTFDTMEDRPKWAAWYDGKRKRVRINTHYHLKDGVWHKCVFTLAGELEPSAPSVFLDDEGNPENPLICQAAYVDLDNDRYGIVRDMVPLQDEANKRRSKFLHLVNSNRWRASPRFQEDERSLKAKLAAPDGVVIGEAGDLESLDTLGKDQGQFQLLMDTRATLKGNIGPNAYLQGKAGESQSGRAVLAQQQAGLTEMTPLLDGLRHFTIRVYRQIWNRIRQYWTAERWIRVTDDENNVRFVQLNAPPELSPEMAQAAAMQVQMMAQTGQLDPQTAQQYMGEIQKRMTVGNHLAELDVDIEIEEVNETPTLQIEQFEQLAQLASSGMLGQPVPTEIVELIIQASNLRDKQKLVEILEKLKTQAGQNPMQQLQVAGAQAQIEETKSKAALNIAKANSEHAGSVVNAFQAEVAAQQPQVPPQF
jgi:hypothetical protein